MMIYAWASWQTGWQNAAVDCWHRIWKTEFVLTLRHSIVISKGKVILRWDTTGCGNGFGATSLVWSLKDALNSWLLCAAKQQRPPSKTTLQQMRKIQENDNLNSVIPPWLEFGCATFSSNRISKILTVCFGNIFCFVAAVFLVVSYLPAVLRCLAAVLQASYAPCSPVHWAGVTETECGQGTTARGFGVIAAVVQFKCWYFITSELQRATKRVCRPFRALQGRQGWAHLQTHFDSWSRICKQGSPCFMLHANHR